MEVSPHRITRKVEPAQRIAQSRPVPLRWCWEPSDEEAFRVAMEHARWARSQHFSTHSVLAGLGERVAPGTYITWLYVAARLAQRWREVRAVELSPLSTGSH